MEKYFNPLRPNHVEFLKTFLETEFSSTQGITLCKFGSGTQHIFKNGKYVMTINWNLI